MKPLFFHSFPQESALAAFAAPSQFQIRPATSGDLSSVAQIIAESFHHQNGLFGWLFPLLRLGIYEDLRHRLTSPVPHHICLVAVDMSADTTSNIVGTVELGMRFSDSWMQIGKSFPYLSNLAVNPQYRRQGAASGLLKACEKVSLSWGFQDLYLHVLENNNQARQLYFKLGYQEHRVESHLNIFFLKRSRQILLRKRLNADLGI
ncbi:GNAT family N-acetyltransferase [Brasilonema sp. UFV-L1]|uniref:GNAT family N-acetyltransferase n=1 Tax=Brasilonema sp. UFV-L1 TaxID=2234130 RepID=UPI00145F2C41|nr:GNAT family N-acetyltransferase [Brasilonema sp. UFV-L1]NMG09170.1 GNAT family N-acetyltransferase [Brasilonema sp. UFV-L1]